MADSLDLTAELLYARLRRSVDLLLRERIRRRQELSDERERRRSAKRLKNLQRIVRKALADYHRLYVEGPPRP